MDQNQKMDAIILSEVFNAIKTYQAGKGTVETYGIANAFSRAMKEEKNCLILYQNKVQNGKKERVFVMVRDKKGRTMFPIFTDMTKVLAVKKMMDQKNQLEIGVMNLKLLVATVAAKQMGSGIMVNPYIQNFSAPIQFFIGLLKREPKSHVTLIDADYMALCVDAAVCPTDEKISKTASLDAMFQNEGGEIFQEAIKAELQGENLGEADVIAVQGSEKLHAKYVLFTNAPAYSEQMDLDTVFECYLNCMNAAKELKCTSLAFPCTSEAMKGLPMEAIIGVSTKAVTTWMASNPDVAMDVYFCCASAEEKDMYQKFFDGLQPKAES